MHEQNLDWLDKTPVETIEESKTFFERCINEIKHFKSQLDDADAKIATISNDHTINDSTKDSLNGIVGNLNAVIRNYNILNVALFTNTKTVLSAMQQSEQ